MAVIGVGTPRGAATHARPTGVSVDAYRCYAGADLFPPEFDGNEHLDYVNATRWENANAQDVEIVDYH